MIGLTLATLALALAAPAPGAAPNPAASAPREAPPAPQPPPEIRIPERRTFTLENGLRVTLVEVGRMPKVLVEVSVRAGSAEEREAEVGLAAFLADMLLEGTTTRSAGEVAAEAARWGGAIEVGVTPDELLVSATVLSEFAPELVGLVAEVVTSPAFPERSVERVRQDRIREVTIARTLPQTLAIERFLAVTYPGSAYGRYLPTPAQLERLGRDDLARFHGEKIGARRAHLYVAGRFDAAATEAAIRAAFAALPPGAPPAPATARTAARRAIHLVERPGAVQSSLYVGLPALDPRHPDYTRLVVTNTLLGGYFSSRMTANLREAKGYTYSPYSVLSVRAGAPGYWAQVADVTTAVTGPALREIFGEIERLRRAPPPERELQATQAYLTGQFALRLAERDDLVERLRFVDLHQLPEGWLEQYAERVRAVTPAEVQATARRWLDATRMATVVVGDRKQVEDQLKGLGSVVVSPPRR